ncbi:MAG: phosphate acyltransferase PlsX [Gemmatimonadota bacterium]|nr:phosphate acyltransferase PlsX [Gemmatimonadota bacterium]MDE3006459.1 phosphate acyltransferase PlsX [Gemmatimonadota bacterium]MDE3014068.1 phosphate acyltransferase PlsX [Gemmatimonadota bacterium]
MRIALDAMGTDTAPSAEVAGAIDALRDVTSQDVEIILVGDEEVVRAELARHDDVPRGIRVHHAPDRVSAEDSPASVIRRKPDSSIVVGLKLHKDGDADGFVSAGPTGAVMASSLFTLRPLPGVDRPPVGTLLPTAGDLSLLLDAGANIGCKPSNLVQFAHLGSTYMRDAMGRENPRVGLLNIGEEPGKGDEVTMETFELLKVDAGLNFIGNIEGRDIVRGDCDVIVCDGFVGNILLKFYESVAGYIVDLLKAELDTVEDSNVDLEHVFRVLDYAEYGGAPLLGLGGVSIICHGGSPPKAIRNALIVAARAIRSGLVKHSAEELLT